MSPKPRPFIETPDPRFRVLLTDDGSMSLIDTVLDESYHSGCGAAAESYHVYLNNSGILDSLQQPASAKVWVLEYGFGTGMNFILTATVALLNGQRLNYCSLEYRLLTSRMFELLRLESAIESLIQQGIMNSGLELAGDLIREWTEFRRTLPEQPVDGRYVFIYRDQIELELLIGDATTYVHRRDQPPFDAVYFDAFSPKTNPDLWTEAVLSSARQSLKGNGRLVTYCVSSAVQRLVKSAGFIVQKTRGPVGGKREVLIAVNAT